MKFGRESLHAAIAAGMVAAAAVIVLSAEKANAYDPSIGMYPFPSGDDVIIAFPTQEVLDLYLEGNYELPAEVCSWFTTWQLPQPPVLKESVDVYIMEADATTTIGVFNLYIDDLVLVGVEYPIWDEDVPITCGKGLRAGVAYTVYEPPSTTVVAKTTGDVLN